MLPGWLLTCVHPGMRLYLLKPPNDKEMQSIFCMLILFNFCFILLTYEGSHREVDRELQHSCDIVPRSGAKGRLDHRFRASPAYTAQLLTPHQHKANNQYGMAKQILVTVRASSNTRTDCHPSTNRAQHCLISVIVRELTFPS